MRLCIVSVFDSGVGAYGRPVFCRSEGEAVRSFNDEVNRVGADNPMYAHPDDYGLFLLGHFDDSSGELLQAEGRPVRLALGSQVKL